ncbi:FHA domain-containing protein [Patulibacter sp.]|uniref:FHA domain-containing protein n=1 Tax=Patulibacter sp. TaxID=1912859 RepID=UPI0027217F26|nr:FHA domain-containing protein [Patulibacter sp.]MDO9408902.1 FHA domain-containing protein [Patulibacter sp.]
MIQPPLADLVEPVSVALKFAIVGVLYLFLAWIARSSIVDLGRGTVGAVAPGVASGEGLSGGGAGEPRLRVERAIGHHPGDEYDVGTGAIIGRGSQVEIQIEDPYASGKHTRLVRQAGVVIVEDLDSTNGTFLNEEPLVGAQPLQLGDRIRIGDTEFTYLDD